MNSKVGVIASVLLVLGIGAAALAVNTKILDTTPQLGIGRANEVLVPIGGPPITATGVTPAPTVPTPPPPAVSAPRSDDQTSHDDHHESETPDRDSDD